MSGTADASADRADTAEAVIASLSFIYREALQTGAQDLASILEAAIAACSNLMLRSDRPASGECADLLRQFYLLRAFRRLDKPQKEALVRMIERLEAGGFDPREASRRGK